MKNHFKLGYNILKGSGFLLEKFKRYLADLEKSAATVEKYVRDAGEFLKFTDGETTREAVMEYKEYISKKYKPKSVNSMLSSVNCFLLFIGKGENRVKLLKVQVGWQQMIT